MYSTYAESVPLCIHLTLISLPEHESKFAKITSLKTHQSENRFMVLIFSVVPLLASLAPERQKLKCTYNPYNYS